VTTAAVRHEHDLLGVAEVPAGALYGIHTLRALGNFAISGVPLSRLDDLIKALASVKLAAAKANRDLGLINPAIAGAIISACEEIRAGRWHDEFVIDTIQGGAGTSTNMNANEVIANRAIVLLGGVPGDYHMIHPLDHVNLCQSTNDAYPTAAKLAAHEAAGRLVKALEELQLAFTNRAKAFAEVVKIGRTQLQDAVPMTLGQELGAFAAMLADSGQRIDEARSALTEVNLGGTAVGTGLNAQAGYAERACAELRSVTGIPFHLSDDPVAATQDVGPFVHLSGALKLTAVRLSKICNDLRLLASGPRAGFGDIRLPAVQAGSSMMPGKVNPVIPEVVNQAAFRVIGNDTTITLSAEAGQLQLNAFGPVIITTLLDSIDMLTAASAALARRCVGGIRPDVENLGTHVRRSLGVVTALSPHIGYELATEVAAEAAATGCEISDVVICRGVLTSSEIEHILARARDAPAGC
jgi:aspartate ammonia-lyase